MIMGGPLWTSTFTLVSFIQVSVSVRPDRLSASGTTADAGHHSRSCADFLLPGLPGTALASVTLAVASLTCRVFSDH